MISQLAAQTKEYPCGRRKGFHFAPDHEESVGVQTYVGHFRKLLVVSFCEERFGRPYTTLHAYTDESTRSK